MSQADVQEFIATHLSPERFAEYLADPDRYRVQVAETAQGLVGYTLVVLPRTAQEAPYAADVAALVHARPAAELSKIYLLPRFHGSGVARALLEAARAEVADVVVDGRPVGVLWLGTNATNRRAQASYRKAGFAPVGRRRFQVGGSLEDDVVMAVDLTGGTAGHGR
ncbi:GNAT family N-acetyltransferase [Georgenia alba]|uniref:GNAT family N-acetyltransferase n=1 Tax=Georgenia alba TaxID=2233858 RepID=A0ABW2Q863_9MICO